MCYVIDVINDKTEKKVYETIEFYEAVRIAYTESEYMRRHFDSPKGINNLNKDNKALWVCIWLKILVNHVLLVIISTPIP
jgi:hypothetical protein